MEIADRRSNKQGSAMMNEEQTLPFDVNEIKNKEGGTQVNYGSVASGLENDDKKTASMPRERSISESKNPLLEQQLSVINDIAHQIDPQLVQKKANE